VNLRQRQVTDPSRDVLGAEPQFVPANNALYRHTRASDARSTLTDVLATHNQGSDIHSCCRHAQLPVVGGQHGAALAPHGYGTTVQGSGNFAADGGGGLVADD